MYTKRKLLYTCTIALALFTLCTYNLMRKLNNAQSEVRITKLPVTASNEDRVHQEILQNVDSLPAEYRVKHVATHDNVSYSFIRNCQIVDKGTDLKELWAKVRGWINGQQLYDPSDILLGSVLNALRNAKIIAADVDDRGTQLKLLLTLDGGQEVVFKPKWYDIDRVIEGPVYSGKDRYGAEILAFYLSAILDFRLTPVTVERVIRLKSEILPVATKRLAATIDTRKNHSCVYGVCHYCKREDPVCEKDNGLKGAVIFQIPAKFKTYRSPWQRTYKKGKKAMWEVQMDYCRTIKGQISKNRLIDLIDVSIFDFLLQNGDRHHYETFNDRVLFLDNGKGLGNPYIHHLDILAPLYQCCILRTSTWLRLKALSGGLLTEILNTIPNIYSFITSAHLRAIEERLLIVYSTVEKCRKRDKIINNLF